MTRADSRDVVRTLLACLPMAVLLLGSPRPSHARPNAVVSKDAGSDTTRAETPAALLEAKDYVGLERVLRDPGGSPHLSPSDRRFYEGVLANRRNRLEKSVDLLRGWLAKQEPADTTSRGRVALDALADDYMKLFRYADAAAAYDDLTARFGAPGDATQRRSARESAGIAHSLAKVRPQTVEMTGPFTLRARRDSLELAEVPVEAGATSGEPAWWIFDTGANMTAITESTARRLGLELSAESTSTEGVTGAVVPIHTSGLPVLRIGGATVRNVAVLVIPDSALYVPQLKFQMDAILGYPVIAALGEVTVFGMDSLHVRPSPYRDLAPDANLFLEELTPLLAASVDGRERLYQFDSGANRSLFTARYAETYRADLEGLPVTPFHVGGAGGTRTLSAYTVPRLVISIAGTTAVLENARVLTAPMGAGVDAMYGNLGQDLVEPFRSYTIDFQGMRFALGEKRQ